MPQLFVMPDAEANISLFAIKIFVDILATGTDHAVCYCLSDFGLRFHLSEIINGRGHLRFYGLNIVQYED